MAVMMRAAGLRGYSELVDELGGNGAAMLGRFGISSAAVASEDALISSEAGGWALEIAAAELRCPDFGLRMAERQDLSILGPLALALANAPTLGAALDYACRYLHIHHPGVTVAVEADPEGQPGIIGIGYRDPGQEAGFAQGVDNALGTLHRMLRFLRGGDYGLRGIQLPHPPLAPVRRYAEYFGAKPTFDHPRAVFRVPADLLQQPIAGSDPTLRTVIGDYLARNFPERGCDMTTRVRVAIDTLMQSSVPTIGAVAAHLSLHERTLQRALAAEGSTFSGLLDDARRDTAYRLLCETDVSMSRITALVGLQEQSALTRAARRWFGATPLQVRKAARVERGPVTGPTYVVRR